MEQALASCVGTGRKRLSILAPAHLQNYASFGFVPVTEVYDEDGIDHIGMAFEIATH
jgi:ElaA protein